MADLLCHFLRRRRLERIALNGKNSHEPISPRPRDGVNRRRSVLAVAQEDALIPSPRRYLHRPSGIQVYFTDHHYADRERAPLVTGLVAAALI